MQQAPLSSIVQGGGKRRGRSVITPIYVPTIDATRAALMLGDDLGEGSGENQICSADVCFSPHLDAPID
jgi:hypothetical protein